MNTVAQVHGVLQCVKIQHCTCTCITCLGNTTGLPVPVLHPRHPTNNYPKIFLVHLIVL